MMTRVGSSRGLCWRTLYYCTVLLLDITQVSHICGFVGDWLAYLLVLKPFFREPQGLGKQDELQVIICGFPRTGTMSLMLAMETLGIRCFHGVHLCKPTIGKKFLKVVKSGSHKDWRDLLDGYGAIADFPAACAYKKLIEIYPNAKVILNIREPNAWYRSLSQTFVYSTHGHWIFEVVSRHINKCVEATFYKDFFEGKPENRLSCIDAYHKHIQEVKAFVGPHRLLIYELENNDGWTSLCAFLDIPCPNVPFPSSNSQAKFRAMIDTLSPIYIAVLVSFITIICFIIASLLK